MKVLIVDDSDFIRRFEKKQLKSLGINRILEAENGNVALDILKKNMPVDVILLDWKMPVMNGLDCLSKIKKNKKYNSVKVVMCTAGVDRGKIVEAIKCGADDYIVKPFTLDILKNKIGLK